MTGAVSTPRYSVEDFETASIRSAAPSYISEAPSYHTLPYNHTHEAIPAYTPAAPRTSSSGPVFAPSRTRESETRTHQQHTVGLPPIPPLPSQNALSIHHFRLPTWSANNGPAARQYRNVAERRITDGRYAGGSEPMRRTNSNERALDNQGENAASEVRPLEDPYLVGEVAAAQARRERIARETGDDILLREDRQWDWLLEQMKGWDERERNWARWRREAETTQRKRLLRRIGGRLLF